MVSGCTLAVLPLMLLFLKELRETYGSVEGYARAAGVPDTDLAALRAHLLD